MRFLVLCALSALAGCATAPPTTSPSVTTSPGAKPATEPESPVFARTLSLSAFEECEPAVDFATGGGSVYIGGRPLLGIKCQEIAATTDTITAQFASVTLSESVGESFALASNPCIASGFADNQILLVTGVAGASNWIGIPNGAGTALMADVRFIAGERSMLLLVWKQDTWVELAYRFEGQSCFGKSFEASDLLSGAQVNILSALNLYPRTQINLSADEPALPATAPQVPVYASGGARTIQGIVSNNAPRQLILFNTGADDIILAEQDGAASAMNRIITGQGAVTIAQNRAATLWYDPGSQRWRLIE